MDIFKGHWPQFKQESTALIYLFIVQTYLNFNYPAFIKLGSPLNICWAVTSSIACALIYLYVFLFPENYAYLINLEFFDDFPDPILIKNIFKGLMFLVANSTYLYLWHINYFDASNVWYAAWYLHNAIALTLVYKAVKKYKNIQSLS